MDYAVPATTTIVYAGEASYYDNGTYCAAIDEPAEEHETNGTSVTVYVTANPDTDEEVEEKALVTSIGTEDYCEVELPPVALDAEQNHELVIPPIGASVPHHPDEAHEETVSGTSYTDPCYFSGGSQQVLAQQLFAMSRHREHF